MNKQRARQKRKRAFEASYGLNPSSHTQDVPTSKTIDEYDLGGIEPIFEKTVFEGAMTLLVGHPGCSKSLYALHIAAALSREEHHTLLFSVEDNYAVIVKPRFKLANGIGRFLHCGDENHVLNLPEDLRYLRTLIIKDKPRLLILDMLDKTTQLNFNDARNVLSIVAPLTVLAAQYKFGVLALLHCSTKRKPTLNTTLGSTKLPGHARVGLVIEEEYAIRERADGQKMRVKTGLKIVKHEKYNYTSKQPNQYFRVKEDEALKTGYLVFESGPDD